MQQDNIAPVAAWSDSGSSSPAYGSGRKQEMGCPEGVARRMAARKGTELRGVASGGTQMAVEINSDTIAEAVVAHLVDCGVLVPRLLTLEQAATYLGMTKDALKAKV